MGIAVPYEQDLQFLHRLSPCVQWALTSRACGQWAFTYLSPCGQCALTSRAFLPTLQVAAWFRNGGGMGGEGGDGGRLCRRNAAQRIRRPLALPKGRIIGLYTFNFICTPLTDGLLPGSQIVHELTQLPCLALAAIRQSIINPRRSGFCRSTTQVMAPPQP